MVLNLNIGILGHVDSGKTTLAKALSQVASTAAFDKHPQSQERGITIDLGFSAMLLNSVPEHLRALTNHDKIQLTLVDCPGHASLIKTIIGGSQIVDLVILVVDIRKGIQTQTAECLVIAELTCQKLIVALNKIDQIPEADRAAAVEKLSKRLSKVLSTTIFGSDVAIVPVSALTGDGLKNFVEILNKNLFIPQRDIEKPFLFAVDHCFAIKGQGTVFTGTVLQGRLKLGDNVEIPQLKECKKVKSMQMFRKNVPTASQGDRLGICVTQFDPKNIERGLLAAPGFLFYVRGIIMRLNRIKYYKISIRSKTKFHITIGHETVMANVTLFKSFEKDSFDPLSQYEYLQELPEEDDPRTHIFVLIEFENPLIAATNSLVIASKLDMDINTNSCRIAFWGKSEWSIDDKSYSTDGLRQLKIFKNKLKQGKIQRVVNDYEVIVHNLFKKESNRSSFIGLKVELSTGEQGFIDSTFGQTSKVKIKFLDKLSETTLKSIRNKENDVTVNLQFKKYVFNKNCKMLQ